MRRKQQQRNSLPEDIEPAVVVLEAPRHHRVANVAPSVEPRGPALDQSLLQFFAHVRLFLGVNRLPSTCDDGKGLIGRRLAQDFGVFP